MGQIAKARVFYGVRIDTGSLPEKAERIYEEVGCFAEGLSRYLLTTAGYESTYAAEDDLPEKTGIRVVSLHNDGVYLVIDNTHHYRSGHGVDRFDMDSIGMEGVLTMESYASWLGTETRLGSWFLASDFS